jgi:hypothetical protein
MQSFKGDIMKRLIRKAEVPTLQSYYNNYDPMVYDFVEIGIQTVNVTDIIGMTDGRSEEYNSDFTPIAKEDSRWDYQKDLVERGEEMEPIPLLKTPDNIYFGNGDGSHRISVAKVLGLQNVQARVTVMSPKENGIGESWEQFAADDIEKLEEIQRKYQVLMKKFPSVQDAAWETKDKTEYNELKKEISKLGNEMSNMSSELMKEENEYKQKMLNGK